MILKHFLSEILYKLQNERLKVRFKHLSIQK